MFHADRQTDRRADGRTHRQKDMTKLRVAFRYFAKKPKNPEYWAHAVFVLLV